MPRLPGRSAPGAGTQGAPLPGAADPVAVNGHDTVANRDDLERVRGSGLVAGHNGKPPGIPGVETVYQRVVYVKVSRPVVQARPKLLLQRGRSVVYIDDG